MQDNRSLPAVLYAAKSTEDVRGTIPSQLEDGRVMAEREGWTVVAEYQDEGFSAYSGNRGPGLERARQCAAQEAESAGNCILVAQHSDRLARGAGDGPGAAEHLVEVLTWANRHNVTLRTVQDDMFSDPRFGLVMAAMMGQRNTEDSRRKSAAVKAGMKRRRAAGKHHGGPRPYGYEYRDGKLAVVEPEAAVVRRLFAEYLAGISQLQITRNLRADGIKTIRGGEWHQGTVRAIVANPIYAGRVGDVNGQHDPIIDPETWAKAEQLRQARARTSGKGRPPAGDHLFRKGMLRCECGEAMVPRTDRNRKDGTYEVYRCYGRHRDPESCSIPPQRRKTIDAAVFNYFSQVALDMEATRRTMAEARNRRLAEIAALRKEAEREAKQADEAYKRIKRDYKRGEITADDWAELKPELEEEATAAEAEAERLRASGDEVQRDDGLRDAEEQTLEQLTAIREAIAGEVRNANGIAAVRAALSRLFEGFILHSSTPEQAHVELIGKVWIEPVVREQAVEGYTESMTPILRPTSLETAENNYAVGLTR